jgi:fatty acid desaturase
VTLREDYGLPRRAPITMRVLAVHLAVLVLAFALWLIVPGAITVAILVIVLLATVGAGVFRVLASRDLGDPPGDTPQPPRA